jgi:CheY-like chemotaxis protein
MDHQELTYYYNKFKYGEDNLHSLMQHRVKEILLISSFFDAYTLEMDGRLSEQIYGEYRTLDLSMAPRITTVPFTEDIYSLIEEREFDMVFIMMRIGNMTPFELCKNLKQKQPDLPILLLLNKQSYIDIVTSDPDMLKAFDDVFLWHGDPKLFIAMIKTVEDRLNADHDINQGHVRVILLVESSIDYYSLFVPLFYNEVMKLTQELIESELTDVNKHLKMRARPKILMAHDYETALELYQKYKHHIICMVSNVNLRVGNEHDLHGGIKLVREIRKDRTELPILMQSADVENRKEARKLNADFVNKDSKQLFQELRLFLVNNIGFGDFVFRNTKGEEIARAKSMYHFEKLIMRVPEESLLYHAERNHFSAWLMAHGEIQIAQQIRHVVASDFLSVDDIRKFLVNTIKKVREKQNKGKVVKFSPSIFTEEEKIVQLAEGSLGGKGRGLAFLNSLLVTMDLDKEFEAVNIKLPKTAIIGTDEFDRFLERNALNPLKISKMDDVEIDKAFMKGKLSDELLAKLQVLLNNHKSPLAIRSSGLLEDSQSQPFAGIYRTFMIPSNHPDFQIRLKRLADAIKCVFASPFRKNARQYIESINFKTEEEKMAVIIQEVCGSMHEENYYYPHFSGTAQSYNFYPAAGMQHEDGIASLAVGLGKAVVDGERCFHFSPNAPKVDMLPPEDIVENAQREFYAVSMESPAEEEIMSEDKYLAKLRIKNSHKRDEFKLLTSVWDYEHFEFLDGIHVKGPRVLSFRNLTHYDKFPLPEILKRILEIGKLCLGVPVEIEFSVNLDKNGGYPTFFLLQIRPLSVNKEFVQVKFDEVSRENVILATNKGMGNGVINNIRDIVFVDPDNFDNTKTIEIAEELEELNKILQKEGRKYILIGPGRWGTSDRFLGIPVRWAQINHAKVVVETNFENFTVDASQGSHFFHNLVALEVGYLTVTNSTEYEFVNWDWLKQQNPQNKTNYLYHVRMPAAATVKIDGQSGRAVIYKPKK